MSRTFQYKETKTFEIVKNSEIVLCINLKHVVDLELQLYGEKYLGTGDLKVYYDIDDKDNREMYIESLENALEEELDFFDLDPKKFKKKHNYKYFQYIPEMKQKNIGK